VGYPRDGGLDLGGVAHVGADRESPPAGRLDLVDGRLAGGLVEVEDGHRRTVRGEPPRRRGTDPARGPGDNGDATHVHSSRKNMHSGCTIWGCTICPAGSPRYGPSPGAPPER